MLVGQSCLGIGRAGGWTSYLISWEPKHSFPHKPDSSRIVLIVKLGDLPCSFHDCIMNSYVSQPAASIVGVQNAQKLSCDGTGIVSDIDMEWINPSIAAAGCYRVSTLKLATMQGARKLNDFLFAVRIRYVPPSLLPDFCSPRK